MGKVKNFLKSFYVWFMENEQYRNFGAHLIVLPVFAYTTVLALAFAIRFVYLLTA